MIIDKSLQATMEDLRNILSEDLEGIKASPARLAKYCKRFCEEAEAGKQRYEEEQACQRQATAMAQQAALFQTEINALKRFWALALSRIPSHYNFWGQISAESLRISYDGAWHLNLPASATASEMPPRFHNFCATLTEVADSVRQYGLEELRDRIQTDVWAWQDQQIEALYTGFFRGKSGTQLRSEYARLYHAVAPFLLRIEGITVVPTEVGAEITFTAIIDDGGLSPDRYYDNVNLLM